MKRVLQATGTWDISFILHPSIFVGGDSLLIQFSMELFLSHVLNVDTSISTLRTWNEGLGSRNTLNLDGLPRRSVGQTKRDKYITFSFYFFAFTYLNRSSSFIRLQAISIIASYQLMLETVWTAGKFSRLNIKEKLHFDHHIVAISMIGSYWWLTGHSFCR